MRLSIVFLAAAALFAQDQKPDIPQLTWMAGCWAGPRGSEEYWMKPAGDTLFGMSRTVAGGKTVFNEFLRIHRKDGEIFLTVQLRDSTMTTSFKLVRGSPAEALFENPEHDFPQRILYRKQPDGSLFARIEGKEKGKERGVDFPMTRMSCE